MRKTRASVGATTGRPSEATGAELHGELVGHFRVERAGPTTRSMLRKVAREHLVAGDPPPCGAVPSDQTLYLLAALDAQQRGHRLDPEVVAGCEAVRVVLRDDLGRELRDERTHEGARRAIRLQHDDKTVADHSAWKCHPLTNPRSQTP
jgi:hypothetical protein